ncbi:MAG: energy transducer TonB [Pseudomonadota bacterium]
MGSGFFIFGRDLFLCSAAARFDDVRRFRVQIFRIDHSSASPPLQPSPRPLGPIDLKESGFGYEPPFRTYLKEDTRPEESLLLFDADYNFVEPSDDPPHPHLDAAFDARESSSCVDETTADLASERVFQECSGMDEPWEEAQVWPDEPFIMPARPDKDDNPLFSDRPRPLGGYFAMLLTSFILHAALLSMFPTIPATTLVGHRGISETPIPVRLVDALEITTPDAPSRASVDSSPSTASLARRDVEREQSTDNGKETTSPREEVSHKVVETSEKHASEDAARSENGSDVGSKDVTRDIHAQVGPPNDSHSGQDSVASLSSAAASERKAPPPAGEEAITYRQTILSAIHAAAYYPGAAVKQRLYGSAVVCFTINRNGSLAGASIFRHADSPILDKAALKIVETASSKFPPIPDSLGKEQITYVVPIVFKRKGPVGQAFQRAETATNRIRRPDGPRDVEIGKFPS